MSGPSRPFIVSRRLLLCAKSDSPAFARKQQRMRRELARLAGSAARLGSRRYERSVVIAQREEFEVAVVGGGSAGCVVARRLAETTSGSVLLLEAGPDLRGDIPAALRDGWSIDEGFDWGYASEPDARGLADELRRGRLLGGTAWVTRFAPR